MKTVNLVVIDGKYENLNQRDLIDKIGSVKPDFLGITSFTQEDLYLSYNFAQSRF